MYLSLCRGSLFLRYFLENVAGTVVQDSQNSFFTNTLCTCNFCIKLGSSICAVRTCTDPYSQSLAMGFRALHCWEVRDTASHSAYPYAWMRCSAKSDVRRKHAGKIIWLRSFPWPLPCFYLQDSEPPEDIRSKQQSTALSPEAADGRHSSQIRSHLRPFYFSFSRYRNRLLIFPHFQFCRCKKAKGSWDRVLYWFDTSSHTFYTLFFCVLIGYSTLVFYFVNVAFFFLELKLIWLIQHGKEVYSSL